MHCEIFKTLFRSHPSNYTMSGLRFFLKELSSTYYENLRLMTIDDFLLTKKGYAGTQMHRGS